MWMLNPPHPVPSATALRPQRPKLIRHIDTNSSARVFAFQEDGYKPLRWRRLICQRNQTHDHSPEEASSVEAATHSLPPPATLDQAVRQPAACQITAGLVSIYRRAPFLLCKGGCYFTSGFGSQELCRGWATVRESTTLLTSRQRKTEAGAQTPQWQQPATHFHMHQFTPRRELFINKHPTVNQCLPWASGITNCK